MNKIFRLLLVGSFILAACGQIASAPTTVAVSPTPSVTPSPTLIPSSTPRPTLTAIPTVTEWISIYPTKQALVIYGASSRNQMTQLFRERGDFFFSPFLTLYADGQLIFGPGVYEKQLSQNEIDTVLTKLNQLSFFALQKSYEADWQNLYYIVPTEPFQAEIGSIEITVFNGEESKGISFGAHDEEDLIQPVRDIIAYLKSFSTNGAKPYQPDRLLVGVETEKEFPNIHDEAATPWPDDITPPSQMSYDGVLYLEGVEALKLYEIVSKSENNVFIFQGIKFVAYLRPILPNECHIYHYYPDPNQPSFTCDNW